MSIAPSVVFSDVTFAWPDGTVVLDGLTASFVAPRTGLVGANGSGKSTLLQLIAGHLQPDRGAVTVSGDVGHLPQGVTRSARTVADLLGVAPVVAAVRAVEAGSVDPADFDTIGVDWDIEVRAVDLLERVGVPADLDRPVSDLSGGEAMLVAVAGVQVRRAPIVLLDEPTNNLDADGRQRLYRLIDEWDGLIIVASHDRDLLNRLDATVELRDRGLTVFGGNYDEYREWVKIQQSAAVRAVRSAEQQLVRQQRERIKAEERIAHSQRQGRKDRANRKYGPSVINDRRNKAEKSQADRRLTADSRIDVARRSVSEAALQVRADDAVRVDVPDPNVPPGRRIVQWEDTQGRVFEIHGPERVGLVGANGAGKSTLLARILPTVNVRVGYLPQRIDLSDSSTVLELVRAAAPDVAPEVVRHRLARLLIRGPMVDRPVGTLSGGERFRVAMASILLADPPCELVVLDEPTNDLDMATVDHVVAGLAAYRGALIVVSHDRSFLRELDLDRVLHLQPDGRIADVTD